MQLGQVYLATNDPESTLFTIEPLLQRQKGQRPDVTTASELLNARALLAMGRIEEAMAAVERAATLSPDDPDILNQSGVVYAYMDDYSAARAAFNSARYGMLDDLIVKNNLAMLDILEHNYKAAIQRLMPLYVSGQADDRIKANLMLALALAGLYKEFKSVYGSHRNETEMVELFLALSTATPLEGKH